MATSTPQASILPEPNQHALFLVARVKDPTRNGSPIAKMTANMPALVDTVANNDRDAALVCTVSFGLGLRSWTRSTASGILILAI